MAEAPTFPFIIRTESWQSQHFDELNPIFFVDFNGFELVLSLLKSRITFLRKGWTGLYSLKGWVGYLPFCHTAGSLLTGLNTLQSLIEKQFEDQQQVLLSPPFPLLAKFIQTESRSGST